MTVARAGTAIFRKESWAKFVINLDNSEVCGLGSGGNVRFKEFSKANFVFVGIGLTDLDL